MALRGRRVTAALSAEESGSGTSARRRAGDGGTNRRIDAVIAMWRIAVPERPNGGRVPRQVGERLARNRAAAAAVAGQGRLPGNACRRPGHNREPAAIRAPFGRFHRGCGRKSAALGPFSRFRDASKSPFSSAPRSKYPVATIRVAPAGSLVAFFRSCDSPNSTLADAEVFL
jgi:hypothetical protein